MNTRQKRGLQSNRVVILVAFLMATGVSTYLSFLPYFGHDLFIGHADQADMANLARNVAEGNGFVVDNVWLHTGGGIPGGDVTHPEPYWSIYVAALIAPSFWLFGASRAALVLPAVLAKLSIVGIVSFWVRQMAKDKALPVVAAIILTSFSPMLLKAINGLSDIYLTAAILATGSVLAFAVARNNMWLFLAAGFLCGFSVGLKPSGLLLLGVWPVYFALMDRRMRTVRQGAVFLVAAAISLAPYLYYNKSSFGTWLPPGLALVGQAADIRLAYEAETGDFITGHNLGFYDPNQSTRPAEKSLRDIPGKASAKLRRFISSGLLDGEVIPLWLAPLVFMGALCVLRAFGTGRSLVEDPNQLMLVFCLLLCAGGLLLACCVTFEGRYWNFMVPMGFIMSLSIAGRMPRSIYVFLMLMTLITGVRACRDFKWPCAPSGYAAVQECVPRGSAVLTANPWEFAFHTRIPAVAVPYTDSVQTLFDLSERYGAEYVVIVDKDSRHPFYKAIQEGMRSDILQPIHVDDNVQILRISRVGGEGD